MRTSKRKANKPQEVAPLIHFPQLPLTWPQLYQRAREIYFARGGVEGMALKDWRLAEQELSRKLKG